MRQKFRFHLEVRSKRKENKKTKKRKKNKTLMSIHARAQSFV